MKRHDQKYLVSLFLLAFFTVWGTMFLFSESSFQRLQHFTVQKPEFRRQSLSAPMQDYLANTGDPGRETALYWMATDFSAGKFPGPFSEETFQRLFFRWRTKEGWEPYVQMCRAIWNDVRYFPVARLLSEDADVSFTDSWMFERNYGGKRGHEGTDIMAEKNVPGYYPVVSMTDGVVTEKGWLEQGGWRIGITAPSGAYFYYAHLDSYGSVEKGDSIQAGQLLGYMGDSGYGKEEGTTGKFPVHLHLGIYLRDQTEEVSVNPYPVLSYIQNTRIKCADSR